jgi:hypothetical protein
VVALAKVGESVPDEMAKAESVATEEPDLVTVTVYVFLVVPS